MTAEYTLGANRASCLVCGWEASRTGLVVKDGVSRSCKLRKYKYCILVLDFSVSFRLVARHESCVAIEVGFYYQFRRRGAVRRTSESPNKFRKSMSMRWRWRSAGRESLLMRDRS